MAPEKWSDIPGYEGCYQASTLGRIRSLDRTYEMRNGSVRRMKGRIRSLQMNGDGTYLIVVLSVGGVHATRTVHSLVAETFLGPKPDGLEVCHGKGGAFDNSVGNLRYDTHRANQRDMLESGNHNEARKDACLRGHALVAPNLATNSRARQCRACFVAHSWKWYRRLRGIATSEHDFRQHADEKYLQIIAGGMLRDSSRQETP